MTREEIAPILDGIRKSIEGKIKVHEDHLSKIDDESTKQFVKGCIAGLGLALLSIPLIETFDVKCNDV